MTLHARISRGSRRVAVYAGVFADGEEIVRLDGREDGDNGRAVFRQVESMAVGAVG